MLNTLASISYFCLFQDVLVPHLNHASDIFSHEISMNQRQNFDLLNANFTSHDELHSMFDIEKSTVKVDCILDGKSDFGKRRSWQSLAVCLASICRLIGASRRHVTPRWGDATLRRDHYECIIYCGLRMCCNSHHRNCIVLAAFKSYSAESGDVYVLDSWNLVS